LFVLIVVFFLSKAAELFQDVATIEQAGVQENITQNYYDDINKMPNYFLLLEDFGM
jgi:hypothetical protein